VHLGSHEYKTTQEYGSHLDLKSQDCVLTSELFPIAVKSSPSSVDSPAKLASNSAKFLLNTAGICMNLSLLSGMIIKTMVSDCTDPRILTPTSVDVDVLPHDRGPDFVFVGLFCLYQGLYLFLHGLYHQEYMSLCMDHHSFMPFKVNTCVDSCPLPIKVTTDFGMLECSSIFYMTIKQDDLRFIDYRIPPDKYTDATYLSFSFFKSICNMYYYQVADYVANMGSLRIFVMTESLLYAIFKVSTKSRAFYKSTTLNTCNI